MCLAEIREFGCFCVFLAFVGSGGSLISRVSLWTTDRHSDDRGRGAPLNFGLPEGSASGRLDHGLEFYAIQGGCASGRPISKISDHVG